MRITVKSSVDRDRIITAASCELSARFPLMLTCSARTVKRTGSALSIGWSIG